MKIVAGIDFGTSMTMIQTLDHDGCEQEMTECKTVRFTQSAQAATPTLVRVEEENGYEWFGEEAQNVNKGVMYENFKLALRSEDPQERQRARDLVERFFRYLYACYKEEKNKLYPGANSAQEETVVGHPVQWDEAQRSIILDAARKAGFKNVRGKDEASASVLCVMTHNQEALRRAGYLQKGKPLNVMVLDMGAGTTDLAFVQVTEQNGGVDIRQQGTWPPKDYPEVFGGSRIDQVLADRMTDWLNACSLPASLTEQFIKGNYLSLKNWKEYNVSSDLEKNLTVDSCTALGMAMNMVQYMPGVTAAPFPAFGRTEYEEMMAADLKVFVNTIRSAPENLREQTDLVFVTGGNSQWYWVPEILSGQNTRFGDVGLPKVKGNPQAIQKTTYPTETVSRGLVYMGRGIRFTEESKIEERKAEPPKVKAGKAETPKADASSQLNDQLVSALKQAAAAKAAASEAEPRKTAAPKAAAPQSNENIFTAWREKRAKAAYPDMKMMERLHVGLFESFAVSDSGCVLRTKEPSWSELFGKRGVSDLRDVDAIFSEHCFRAKDGKVIDSSGNFLWEADMHPLQGGWLSDVMALDSAGRVRLNTLRAAERKIDDKLWENYGGKEAREAVVKARQRVQVDTAYLLSSWSQQLEALYDLLIYTKAGRYPAKERALKLGLCNKDENIRVCIGLTQKGEICTLPPMREWLHTQYPALKLNSNGTFGEGIVEFAISRFAEVLYVLTKTGELYWCEAGSQNFQKNDCMNIAHIGSLGVTGVWAIDDLGNLLKWEDVRSMQNAGEVLMTNCVAAAEGGYSIIAMDKQGKVKYVLKGDAGIMRRSKVESWNIHDAK